MQVKGDALVNKLILLFVFDKMEAPLSENTVLDMCCGANAWISYMDCKPLLGTLLDHSFIYNVSQQGDEPLYGITPDGRVCLAARRNFVVRKKQPLKISQKSTVRSRLLHEQGRHLHGIP